MEFVDNGLIYVSAQWILRLLWKSIREATKVKTTCGATSDMIFIQPSDFHPVQTSSPSPNKIATLHCFIYVKVVGRNNEVYVKVVWTSIQKVWDEDIAGWWGHANEDGVGQGAKRVHFGATPLLHHPLAPLGPLMQKMQNLGLATLQLSLSFGSSSCWWSQDKCRAWVDNSTPSHCNWHWMNLHNVMILEAHMFFAPLWNRCVKYNCYDEGGIEERPLWEKCANF